MLFVCKSKLQVEALHGDQTQIIKEIDQDVNEFEQILETKHPISLVVDSSLCDLASVDQHISPALLFDDLSPEAQPEKVLSEEEATRQIQEIIRDKKSNALEVSKIDHFDIDQVREHALKKAETEGPVD